MSAANGRTHPISYGEVVVCADPDKEWYGWIGIVRGKNTNNIGIEFEEDSAEPPKGTGRWVAREYVVPVSELQTQPRQLQEAVSRYKQWSTLLAKARESAILAVETYNRPTASFRTGAFTSLMIIAWTSLLLSVIVRRGDSPYEIDEATGAPRRVGGDLMFLGIKQCIAACPNLGSAAARANLELFISLRNKIEHADVPGLDEKVFGEVQALLRNFEAALTLEFGRKFGINPGLAFPITFSYAPPDIRADVLRAKASDETTAIFGFVDQFRIDLDRSVFESQEYSFRVFLLPRVGNHLKSADVAVEWVDVDADDPQAVAAVPRQVTALLKERHLPVHNLGLLRPGKVASKVQEALSIAFSASSHHAICCKQFGAWKNKTRPSGPGDVDSRYVSPQ